MTEGGAKDPDKYKYTRVFAGVSLGVVVIVTVYIVIALTIRPGLADSYEKVSGILIMLIGTLGAIVGGYMGVSNSWGRK